MTEPSTSTPGDPTPTPRKHTPAELERRSIERSLEDARLLVWHASRSGIGLDAGTVKTIVDARERYQTGDWDSEIEAAFWVGLDRLSANVRPVTIESIRASQQFGGDSHKAVRRIVWQYRWSTIGVLIALLACQVYWLWGNNIAKEIDTLTSEYRASELEYQKHLIEDRDLAEKIQEKKARFLEIAESDSGPLPPEASERVLVEEMQERRNELAIHIARLEHEQSDKAVLLESNHTLLEHWDLFHGVRESVAEFLGAVKGPPPGGSEPTTTKRTEGAVLAAVDTDIAENVNLIRSRAILSTMNQYVLPLLYGLLGALAFILRTLGRELRAITYSPASNTAYVLRWPLGMLAGITIGWFFDPATLQGVASIQPLALAFLAGYSVELLFALLDRIVSAFTEPQGARA